MKIMRSKGTKALADFQRVLQRRLGLQVLIGILVVLSSMGVQADPPSGYYDLAAGKSGQDLLDALHEIIGPHQRISYDGLWNAYEKTDATDEGRPSCIYSEFPFESFKPNPSAAPGKIGSFLTREHSFPKDWWDGTKNDAYSDLFHVILGDAHVNGQKGVNPLGEVDASGKVFGVSKVGPARSGMGYRGMVFEPADHYKGDFARNYLYFSAAYMAGAEPLECALSPMVGPDGVTFTPWAIRLLLKWHAQDPVSDRERNRNEAVYGLQGNRNPFIDHPEFAERIWSQIPQQPFLVGADANYSLEMEKAGARWGASGSEANLFDQLRHAGFDSVRIRLWTGDEGPGGLKYATEVARQAHQAGLTPYLVIFLSENWADYVKQPVPKIWEKLSFEDKVKAVEAYTENVARHFQEQGIPIDYFEIGNEIDFGICGEFEEDWGKRLNADYMKAAIWPRTAAMIAAAQKGVRKVRPKAKFALHLTQWWNPEFCADFFVTMIGAGVSVDFAGLSFFPTSNLTKESSLEDFFSKTEQLYTAVRRPIFICEFGYPSEAKFPGQFAEWNKPVAGFSLDETGQEAWIRAFLRATEEAGYIDAVYYWSPEWFDSSMWSAFALFGPDGQPKKALEAFARYPGAP